MPVLSKGGSQGDVAARTANCVIQFSSAGIAGAAWVDGYRFFIPSPSSVGTLSLSPWMLGAGIFDTQGQSSIVGQTVTPMSIGVALQNFTHDASFNLQSLLAGTSISVRYKALASGGQDLYVNDNWTRTLPQ